MTKVRTRQLIKQQIAIAVIFGIVAAIINSWISIVFIGALELTFLLYFTFPIAVRKVEKAKNKIAKSAKKVRKRKRVREWLKHMANKLPF
jgi:hypothetical protein